VNRDNCLLGFVCARPRLRRAFCRNNRRLCKLIADAADAHAEICSLPTRSPSEEGLTSGVADYFLRLRVAARPARPRPRRARVPGSGTATSFTKMEKPFGLVMLLNASEKESPL